MENNIQITIKVVHLEENPKQVKLTLEGLDREMIYDFQTEEDAETASRLGGALLDCFRDMSMLGAKVTDSEIDQSEAVPETDS